MFFLPFWLISVACLFVCLLKFFGYFFLYFFCLTCSAFFEKTSVHYIFGYADEKQPEPKCTPSHEMCEQDGEWHKIRETKQKKKKHRWRKQAMGNGWYRILSAKPKNKIGLFDAIRRITGHRQPAMTDLLTHAQNCTHTNTVRASFTNFRQFHHGDPFKLSAYLSTNSNDV